ncbi:Di-copper centre-containing protein [Wilcoxina mikolae CBS 423.85]|nr:Di-copper centre-containing protein [Wilcoxina mikolae CBS 423.85]
MKAWTFAALAASLVSVVSSTPLVPRQQSYTPVTGPTDGIYERLPIQRLMAEQPEGFNLYLLALQAMQKVPESNPLSYYQLAGIHGRPHIPWGEPSNPAVQDTRVGYCTHSSALFVTWHRPYLSLIEQRLVYHAKIEAAKFNDPKWKAAAKKLRLPYWDWAADDLKSGIPGVVMQPTVSLTQPTSSGGESTVTIANPLYQYSFTNQDYRNRYFTGFYTQAAHTLRQPLDASTSQNNVADQVMRAAYTARRQNTYNLFSIPTFHEFSSTAFSIGGTPNAWTSVESIHNQVHSSMGGTTPGLAGHMSLVDYSSFDPIFWLHHVQVDRLGAMYQATHPGQVVTPQPASPVFARRVTASTVDTIDTPLWPFRHPSGSYFTSRDVSTPGSVWDYGYSYPEIPLSYKSRPTADLRSFVIGRINALYSPAALTTTTATTTAAAPSTTAAPTNVTKRATGTRREWICHFVFSPAEVGGPAQLDIYFGNATATPGSSDYYVGSGSALGKEEYTDADKGKLITATVPLTVAIQDQGINCNDRSAVVKELASKLKWIMRKGPNDSYDLTKLPSLKVGVSSAEVTYTGDDNLPQWGNFETYYEVTDKKDCGMKKKDSNIVKSDDAKDYLGNGK